MGFRHHPLNLRKSLGDGMSPLESLARQTVNYWCHKSAEVFYEPTVKSD